MNTSHFDAANLKPISRFFTKTLTLKRMGRWLRALWRVSSSSQNSTPFRRVNADTAANFVEDRRSQSIWGDGTVHNVMKCAKAGMATNSGDGDGKKSSKDKWRQWVEGKLAETESSKATNATSPTPAATQVDDFERFVLGKTGDDEENEEADFHALRDIEAASVEETSATQTEEDDFLEELTKIEKGGISFGETWGRKKEQSQDLMMKRGYDDEKVPFDEEVDPENDESLLEKEDAVFWNEELQKFVTPKGVLNLPGMGTTYQLRPDKTYFPGFTNIDPEDFDVTRAPAPETPDQSPKAQKEYVKSEVLAAADFRNVRFLSLFLSETSRVLPRRTTKIPMKCQKKIAREIKTARALGLIPFSSMGEQPFRYLRDRAAKDVDPEDEYQGEEIDDEDGGRFRRRLF